MTTFTVNGETYDMLSDDTMTWAEAAAVEKVSGVSLVDPNRKPSLVLGQAIFWVSMKRKQPDLKFSDLNDLPIGAFDVHGDEEDADPLEPTP